MITAHFRALAAPFRRLVDGFLFVPSIMALGGLVAAILAVSIDRSGALDFLFDGLSFLAIDAAGARAVLGTVAGAMMTVISLVYSLTLVVFTLAAGNIGPRLLKTFATNRVNQITIGLLGATFLYALIVLYIVGSHEVPKLAVALAILLATLSFFWVVYFVHDVAQRIMVDNEVARSQRRLRHAIAALLAEERPESKGDEGAIPSSASELLTAADTGYVTSINRAALADIAKRCDGFIEVLIRPGDFVIEDQPIVRLFDSAGAYDRQGVHAAFILADARSPEGDLKFNLHLNVEIALRALSPGINDSYTAMSVIDHLSGSLAALMKRGVPSSVICDDLDEPRLWINFVSVEEIVNDALHPLRRASRDSFMVMNRLVEAIGRVRSVTSDERRDLLDHHLKLIAGDARSAFANQADRKALAAAIRSARSPR